MYQKNTSKQNIPKCLKQLQWLQKKDFNLKIANAKDHKMMLFLKKPLKN